MSHNPGIRNLPVASTICASGGREIFALSPIAEMRSPVITTVASRLGGEPVTSMIVACVKTIDAGVPLGFARANNKTLRISSKTMRSFIVLKYVGAI
jgi:hypothetical protein